MSEEETMKMKKKEIEKTLQKPLKSECIYQRYNGHINKLEKVGETQFIDVQSEIAIDTRIQSLPGRISKNIIDLIEEGDIVNGYPVVMYLSYDEDWNDLDGLGLSYDYEENTVLPLEKIEIKTILTHEQYEQNCFKMKKTRKFRGNQENLLYQIGG